MKIIKPGNPRKEKKARTFHCEKCECIFEARPEEYELEKYDECHFSVTYATVTCPFCGVPLSAVLD